MAASSNGPQPYPISSRRSESSVSTPTGSPDFRKQHHVPRESRFFYQNGHKLHAYGRDKAPYPCAYNREFLDLLPMDRLLIQRVQNSISFVDFKGKIPTRCLDLGCGYGDWVVLAARTWPDCTFVGYDLVNVQIPLHILEDDERSRIEWKYGNILRTRLPFDDDEFDFIRIQSLAFAIPENKWHSTYEEIYRVLRPGGIVEQVEEDAVFPILPRWFTDPLRAHARGPSKHLAGGSQLLQHDFRPQNVNTAHEHELLEKLFYAVFDNRFINRTPTSLLPSYFSAIFSHVRSPPAVEFPMPALAPMAPMPPELSASSSSFTSDSDNSQMDFFLSSFYTSNSDDIPETSSFSPTSTLQSPSSGSLGSPESDTNGHDKAGTPSSPQEIGRSASLDSQDSVASAGAPSLISSISTLYPHAIMTMQDEGTRLGPVFHLFALEELHRLDEHSLYMHLYASVRKVLCVREAMWEELREMVTRRDTSLRAYGWDVGDDFAEKASRQKFDAMVDQYEKDMRVRISLWHSLVRNGWDYPPRDPLTKAEIMEEDRIRQDMLRARRSANGEEGSRTTRAIRLILGEKPALS